MVSGLEKSKELVNKMDGIEALFIYSDGQGGVSYYVTDQIADKITIRKE